jgi:hypothetical protein
MWQIYVHAGQGAVEFRLDHHGRCFGDVLGRTGGAPELRPFCEEHRKLLESWDA